MSSSRYTLIDMLEKCLTTTNPQLAYLSYESSNSFPQSPTLVIFHGLFGMADNWNSIARGLDLRVLSFDLPGHGGSGRLGSYTYENFAQAAYQAISSLVSGPVYLLGHSLGGKIAMTLADRGRFPHFAQLKGLIVVDIAPLEYPDSHTQLFRALESLDLSKTTSRGQAQAVLAKAIPDPGLRGFLLKNLEFDPSSGARWFLDLGGLRSAYDELRAWPGTLLGYNGPALWIGGELSEYMKPRERVRQAIISFAPRAEIDYIEGAGHWVHAEQRGRVIELLGWFIESLKQETSNL